MFRRKYSDAPRTSPAIKINKPRTVSYQYDGRYYLDNCSTTPSPPSSCGSVPIPTNMKSSRLSGTPFNFSAEEINRIHRQQQTVVVQSVPNCWYSRFSNSLRINILRRTNSLTRDSNVNIFL